MNNSSNIPGMVYPTQQAMLSGSPRDSAIANMNLINSKLTDLQSVGGKGRTKKYGGNKPGNIIVPQFNMLYNSTGGPGQTPNDIIKQNAIIGTQGAENAVFDKYATQKGGNVYINPNTNKYEWGCYSGGKKYRKNKQSRKIKKTRKTRKSRKSRKNKKTRKTRN